MTTHHINRLAALGALLTSMSFLLGAAPAQAQTMDARWLPWVGCWQPVDSLGNGNANGPMLCFRPVAGQTGVEMISVQADTVVSHRIIQADGQAHRESRDGCSGVERAQFSSDGRRVFTVADIRCQGGTTRKTTGIMSMTDPTRWLDVRSLDIGGKSTPWVVRYELASPERTDAAGFAGLGGGRALAIQSARMAAAAPLDVHDVVEASKVVAPAALKAWIAESDEPFNLDASTLLALKKAGVPGDVIDVMVAVTYPNKFALGGPPAVRSREASRAPVRTEGYYPGSGGFAGCDPFFWSPYCFGGYGYYGYGVTPYPYYGGGYYGGWGYGGYYGGYTPVFINVQPATSTSGYAHGRVVNGRGYTRGAPVESSGGSSGSSGSAATPNRTGGTSTGRTAHPRGGGGQAAPAASSRGSGVTPDPVAARPQFRSPSHPSSGGRSTGRTAHPRGGGGRR